MNIEDKCTCIDCVCPQCHTAWLPNTKFELCEGSKLYKGRAWLNRACVTCAETVSIPLRVNQTWVDAQTTKLFQRALKERHGETDD